MNQRNRLYIMAFAVYTSALLVTAVFAWLAIQYNVASNVTQLAVALTGNGLGGFALVLGILRDDRVQKAEEKAAKAQQEVAKAQQHAAESEQSAVKARQQAAEFQKLSEQLQQQTEQLQQHTEQLRQQTEQERQRAEQFRQQAEQERHQALSKHACSPKGNASAPNEPRPSWKGSGPSTIARSMPASGASKPLPDSPHPMRRMTPRRSEPACQTPS